MAGNSFGEIFRITTFGESHGPAVGAVIDGVPPGLPLTVQDIQKDLDRRRPGQSSLTTQRRESDTVEILSGVWEDRTTGTPIALLIRNADQRPRDYDTIKDVFRPGHADFTYLRKYGLRDYRGGGRASGRETAARVAAGAVAKKVLDPLGVRIVAYTAAVGEIRAEARDLSAIEGNPVRCPDPRAAEEMERRILDVRKSGDSIGGIVEAVVQGTPAGWGDPVFGKLDARLARAVLSIGAVKAVEFGEGFAAARRLGSEHNDPFIVDPGGRIRPQTNRAGGILGGITTGEEITLRLAVKPPSSILKPQRSVSTTGEPVEVRITGRHDPCLCPRIVPVVEAMIAVTLADCCLLQRTVR